MKFCSYTSESVAANLATIKCRLERCLSSKFNLIIKVKLKSGTNFSQWHEFFAHTGYVKNGFKMLIEIPTDL